MKNRVVLNINDVNYSILAAEPEEYVQQIGKAVDLKMREILSSGPGVSTLMAAVLTAVNICDELHKANDTAENLRVQLKQYLEELSKSKMENDESRKEIAKLYHEIQALKVQLAKSDVRTEKKV